MCHTCKEGLVVRRQTNGFLPVLGWLNQNRCDTSHRSREFPCDSYLHSFCDDCRAKIFKQKQKDGEAHLTPTCLDVSGAQVSPPASTNFLLFQQLPKELRLQVWHLAQEDESFSRIIQVVQKRSRLTPQCSNLYKVQVRSHPTLLQINRESRYELMPQYVTPFLLENTYTPLGRSVAGLVINPTTDILFLAGVWNTGIPERQDTCLPFVFTKLFGKNSLLVTKQLRTLALDRQPHMSTYEGDMFWAGISTPQTRQESLRQFMPNLKHLISTYTRGRLIEHEGGKILSFPMPTSPRNSLYPHPNDGSKFGIQDLELELGLQNMMWGDVKFGGDAGVWPMEVVPIRFLSAIKKQEEHSWKEHEKVERSEARRKGEASSRIRKRDIKRHEAYRLKLKATRNREGKQEKCLRDGYWQAVGLMGGFDKAEERSMRSELHAEHTFPAFELPAWIGAAE